MTRIAFALLASALAGGTAWGQFPPNYPQQQQQGFGQPGFTQQGFGQQPQFNNRPYQSPLSPYLNLLGGAGGIPAVNYYNGTQMQMQNMGGMNRGMGGMMNRPGSGFSQQQMGYLPQAAAMTRESVPLPDPNAEVTLPPSGHFVAYGNQYGQNRGGSARNGFFPQPTTGQKPKGK